MNVTVENALWAVVSALVVALAHAVIRAVKQRQSPPSPPSASDQETKT